MGSATIYAVTCLVGVGGFLFGYDIGIISGVLAMESFTSTFPATKDPWSKGFVVTSFVIGSAVGSMFMSWLADTYGRRATLRVGAFAFVIGGGAQAFCTSLNTLYAFRVVSGFAIGLTASIVPLYNSELAPASQRGMLITFNQIFMTGGILVSFWINYWLSDRTGATVWTSGWRLAMLLQCVPGVVLFVGALLLPRSPRWLVQQGKKDEAEASLRTLRGTSNVGVELGEIVQSVEEARTISMSSDGGSSSAEPPWSLFLTDPTSRRRLITGMLLQTGQQLTGINSIMYYGPQIFAQAMPGVKNAGLLAQGINGVVNFASTFLAFCLLDRVGRKPLLVMGAFMQMVCMFVLATVGVMYATVTVVDGKTDVSIESRGAGLVCILSVYLFVNSFAYSWGPAVWALCSEIFPNNQRAKGVALTTTTNWIWNIVIGQFYPPIQAALGFKTFYIFGGTCAAMFLWSIAYAPETKGLSIDQVESLFDKRRSARADMKEKLRTSLLGVQ